VTILLAVIFSELVAAPVAVCKSDRLESTRIRPQTQRLSHSSTTDGWPQIITDGDDLGTTTPGTDRNGPGGSSSKDLEDFRGTQQNAERGGFAGRHAIGQF